MTETPDFRLTWRTPLVMEWPLVLGALGLSIIGLGLIYSATAPLGESGRTFVLKQITWLSLGVVLMALVLIFDYHVLEQGALWFYGGIIIALVVVWTLGKVTAGSKRWIDLGLMRFQPSEFAKLAVVVVLARFCQFESAEGARLPELVKPVVLAALPALLVSLQPDLGTASLIVLIAGSMVLYAGVERRILVTAGLIAVVVIPLIIGFGDHLLLDYQKKRLMTYINPAHDPLGAGYHIVQSQIAIGSGGLWGQGFLQGMQNQLMFLPVKHTDFIFSILGEEWGFVGSSAVLFLFSLLFLRGLDVARKARDRFGALLAFGCTAMMFWHVVINTGMVMGLVPVVGVPLSFVSYGGSSLLASYLAIAILVNVSMRRFSF